MLVPISFSRASPAPLGPPQDAQPAPAAALSGKPPRAASPIWYKAPTSPSGSRFEGVPPGRDKPLLAGPGPGEFRRRHLAPPSGARPEPAIDRQGPTYRYENHPGTPPAGLASRPRRPTTLPANAYHADAHRRVAGTGAAAAALRLSPRRWNTASTSTKAGNPPAQPAAARQAQSRALAGRPVAGPGCRPGTPGGAGLALFPEANSPIPCNRRSWAKIRWMTSSLPPAAALRALRLRLCRPHAGGRRSARVVGGYRGRTQSGGRLLGHPPVRRPRLGRGLAGKRVGCGWTRRRRWRPPASNPVSPPPYQPASRFPPWSSSTPTG